jgi:hypothetical protein
MISIITSGTTIKNYLKLLFVGYIPLCFSSCSEKARNVPQTAYNPSSKIIVECKLPSEYYKMFLPGSLHAQLTSIKWVAADTFINNADWETENQKLSATSTKWVLNSEKMLRVQTDFLLYPMILSPGDSICIEFSGERLVFSGKGAEAIMYQDAVEQILRNTFFEPTLSFVHLSTLDDYFKWKNLLDKQLDLLTIIFEYYENKVPFLTFEIIKTNAIYSIERRRQESFFSLYATVKKSDSTLATTDLSAIYDSTIDAKWINWFQERSKFLFDYWYFYQYARIQILKKYNFDIWNDNINSDSKRRILYYTYLENNFKDLLLEKLLQYVVVNKTILDLGLDNPVTDSILRKYYQRPGIPEYKWWMKTFEDSIRQKARLVQKQ